MPTSNICLKELTSDIESNCTNPVIMGYEHDAYIINKKDIISSTKEGNVVSAIELAPTKKAYKIKLRGKTPFNGTNVTMQDGDFPDYTKSVVMKVVNDGAPTAQIMNILKDGEFVVVLESKYSGGSVDGDAKFEAIGFESGAKATAQVKNRYENGGGWDVTLTEEHANDAGIYVNAGGVQATRTMLDALVKGDA